MTPEQRASECLNTETADYVDSRLAPRDIRERIAAAIRAAVAEEREACATMLDATRLWPDDARITAILRGAAEDIRARGTT